MGNDDAFRKVRDKLAGFESDLRDDSWQLFEKHRRRKERGRKLAGVIRAGMAVLFILGALFGSWIFLHSGRRMTPSVKSGTIVQKKAMHAGVAKTDSAQFKVAGFQENLDMPVKEEFYIKSGKTNTKPEVPVPVSPGLMLLAADSSIAGSPTEQYWQTYLKILSNKAPSPCIVNLQLPAIQQSELHTAEDTSRSGRRFQFSLGPAVRANYAKPSENRLTLGPAVFGTFPVTSTLSLRGGLALMREHVYVSNTNPEFSRNAVRWLSRGDYRWWELEIPMDIQLRLYHNPGYSLSGLFGVSSSLYWGEHFRELYQKDKIVTTTLALYNGEVREVQGLASKQEDPLTGNSGGVVFAPVTYFNASILLEKKITPRSSVVVEPQLRYPVGGVTSRHLKFTSIGVQVRILYK